MTTIAHDYTPQIVAGATFLDERARDGLAPADWRARINVEKLDMFVGTRCVIGQVFGNYYDGMLRLGAPTFEEFIDTSWASVYGFDVSRTDLRSNWCLSRYDELTNSWKDYLRVGDTGGD